MYGWNSIQQSKPPYLVEYCPHASPFVFLSWEKVLLKRRPESHSQTMQEGSEEYSFFAGDKKEAVMSLSLSLWKEGFKWKMEFLALVLTFSALGPTEQSSLGRQTDRQTAVTHTCFRSNCMVTLLLPCHYLLVHTTISVSYTHLTLPTTPYV